MEPDKPAWQDIVAYFGEQILADYRTLDRNKLREIVFQDLEKKKKLETIKTNKEYDAIHQELASLKQAISDTETRILQIIDAEDSLQS